MRCADYSEVKRVVSQVELQSIESSDTDGKKIVACCQPHTHFDPGFEDVTLSLSAYRYASRCISDAEHVNALDVPYQVPGGYRGHTLMEDYTLEKSVGPSRLEHVNSPPVPI
jgi:hypothetical protein